MTLVVVPVEDILLGVKKVIGALPEETAEEVGQEIVRTLTGSHKPKDNLTVAKRKTLKGTDTFTHHSADKVNATVILDNWKIAG
jgi:hypothetical protein